MEIRRQRKTVNLKDIAVMIALLYSIFGLAGCQPEGPAEKAGQKIDKAVEKADDQLDSAQESLGGKAEKSENYLDDSAITAKIKAEILSDPLLKVAEITVTTTGGVVKLSGLVDSQQSIERAAQIARNDPHVKAVENGLAVK